MEVLTDLENVGVVRAIREHFRNDKSQYDKADHEYVVCLALLGSILRHPVSQE